MSACFQKSVIFLNHIVGYHYSKYLSSEGNIQLAQTWITIYKLSIIWKSDLANKIKHYFFQRFCFAYTTVWIHRMKKLYMFYKRMLGAVLNKSWKKHPHTIVVRPLASHLTNHPSKTNKTCWAPLVD